MFEYTFDDIGVGDVGDVSELATAMRASLDIDVEDALQALRPGSGIKDVPVRLHPL